MATIGLKLRYNLNVVVAFVRIAFDEQLAYRTSHWVTFINMLVRMYAIGVVWDVLTTLRPGIIPIDRPQMVTYGMLAVILNRLLEWWDGPHTHLSNRIREGTITTDLRWPISLPVQLFSRSLGIAGAQVLLFFIPGFLMGILLLGMELPANPISAILFVVSAVLGFLILFLMNLILGVLAVFLIKLDGVDHLYHGVIMLFSGAVVPLSLFPGPLETIAKLLPFSGIFSTPLLTYIGEVSTALVLRRLLHQVIWIIGLAWLARKLWDFAHQYLVVHGG